MPELHHRTIPTASTGTKTLHHKTIPAASTATRTLYTASIQHTYFLTILHHMKTDRRNTGFYKDISYKTFIHIWTTYNELLSDIYTVNSSIFCIITNNFHRFGHYKTITAAFNIIIYFNIFNTIFASNITQRL